MPLKAHEVLTGVLGLMAEVSNSRELHLRDRRKLYECVRELCVTRPGDIFDFQFRNRSGELVSPDVDLCLRNLEDSERLRCLNPDLVDFEETDTKRKEFTESVRPRLEEMQLLDLFMEASKKCLAE